ncbi:hypothetical protein GA0115240_12045 [Streptomyces sp. DvalAA-14]|nr:hypothetical protein GA0115240_12045 [Streptomyces sp. DvalAA-14]
MIGLARLHRVRERIGRQYAESNHLVKARG